MDIQEAQKLMDDLLAKHALYDWQGRIKRFKQSLAKCYFDPKVIALSSYFVEQMPVSEVKDVILHEIAHALMGKGSGHRRPWKQKCIEVGCKPERIYKGESIKVPYKWKITCVKCGEVIYRHRRPSSRSLHKPDMGKLKVDLNNEPDLIK
jgi:predicted SprT family Zn-dependent metalloprotease